MNWKDRASKAALEKLAELHLARKMLKAEKDNLTEAKAHLETTLEAQSVIQAVAAGVQATVHDRIAGIVSKCLSMIFDEPYLFKIYFDQKRGKTEARVVLVDSAGNEVDPKTECGGGVVDVTAFALRLAALTLSRPQGRMIMVLDEPFRFLSRGYGERVKELLETLAKEMDVQFVIVTHDAQLQAGKVLEIA